MILICTKNNHQIIDYDKVLDEKFGKVGTPERAKAERDAYNFFMHSSPAQEADEGEQRKRRK